MKKYWLLLMIPLLYFTSCRKDHDFVESSNMEEEQAYDDITSLTLYDVSNNDISLIKDYEVDKSLQLFQVDKSRHFTMWHFVIDLIPLKYRDKITQFEIFYGYDDVAGYVVEQEDLGSWKLALAIDFVEDFNNIDAGGEFTALVLHEYGHILTLNDTQVTASEEEESCNTYFPGEGCSLTGSYLYPFYQLGWADIIDDRAIDNPDRLYNKYPDRFVSDYAATNPAEDIAEVVTQFIMQDKPVGNSIADQKIKLLYDFPELVELREDIRVEVPVVAKRNASYKPKRSYTCGCRGCRKIK